MGATLLAATRPAQACKTRRAHRGFSVRAFGEGDRPVTSPKFDASCAALLDAVRAGASVDDAARECALSVHTVRGWIRKGRLVPGGAYGRFAAEVDAVRQLQRLPTRTELQALTRDEVERIVAKAARAGNMTAVRVWLDMHRAELEVPAGDGLSWLDQG